MNFNRRNVIQNQKIKSMLKTKKEKTMFNLKNVSKMKNLKVMMMTLMMCLMTMVSMTSCEKEEIKPCNCGTIANDGIDNGCYWLEIRNDCSGNKKKFCFDQDVWMNSYVGSNFCVTNEPQW